MVLWIEASNKLLNNRCHDKEDYDTYIIILLSKRSKRKRLQERW